MSGALVLLLASLERVRPRIIIGEGQGGLLAVVNVTVVAKSLVESEEGADASGGR